MVASLPTLFSVHVAKAGGTSTGEALRKAYRDALAPDYQDDPANPISQRVLDPNRYFSRNESLLAGIKCVHGHFHPGKYNIPKDAILFTLLRHPVENILSIYFAWRVMERRPKAALLNYVKENNLNVIETARLPLLRWLFSRTYFEHFDMGRFDTIGRHEDRGRAFAKLSWLIGAPLDVPHVNQTPPSDERQAAANDRKLRAQLEDILADDIRFYERYAR
jgi:hypothetical protein